jgi:hypothetical protein
MKAVRCKAHDPYLCRYHGKARASELKTGIEHLQALLMSERQNKLEKQVAHTKLQQLVKEYNATDTGYRQLAIRLAYTVNPTTRANLKQQITEANLLRSKQEVAHVNDEPAIQATVSALTTDIEEATKSKFNYVKYKGGVVHKTITYPSPSGENIFPVAPDGKSAWFCHNCRAFFSKGEEEAIKSTPKWEGHCHKCDTEFTPDMITGWGAVHEKNLDFLENPEEVKKRVWYHATTRGDWEKNAEPTKGGEDIPYLHVGTLQAARDRIKYAGGDANDWVIYEVEVNPETPVSPIVFGDDYNAPKTYQTAVALNQDSSGMDWNDPNYLTLDVKRYVNQYETPGDISLIVHPGQFAILNKTTVAEIP